MTNHAVTGRVVYAGTAREKGISGLVVKVIDLDAVPDEDRVATTETDPSGRFAVGYPGSAYGALEIWPDLVVRIFDQHGRLVHETDERPNCSAETVELETIELARGHVEGWVVTDVFRTPLDGHPLLLSDSGNDVEVLVDNQRCWSALIDAIKSAAGFVHTLQLLIDVGNLTPTFDGDDQPKDKVPLPRNGFEMAAIAAHGRGLPVRVLVNEFTDRDIALGLADSVAEVTPVFEGTGVEVRTYKTNMFAPLHVKATILQDARGSFAIINGSPLLQEYFDTTKHKISDRRRGQLTKYYGTYSQIRRPIHDVSALVRGPVVDRIEASFEQLWNVTAQNGQPGIAPVAGAAAVPDGAAIQVLRTLGPGRHLERPEGETGILQGYQRAIGLAQHFIYLENQYFTNLEIVKSLLHALRDPQLRIVLLTNSDVDAPGYPDQQLAAIEQLCEGARTLNAEARVGVFTAWSHEPAGPGAGARPQIAWNYIHSKVGIVDESWATIGSANLDGASLNCTKATGEKEFQHLRRPYQHALPRRPDNPQRSTELNLAIYNGVDGLPKTPLVRKLRVELWSEHLGLSQDDARLQRREGDVAYGEAWLALWNERANAKCDALVRDPSQPHPARILPWRAVRTVGGYLAALGVPVDKLEVFEKVPGFNLDTGEPR